MEENLACSSIVKQIIQEHFIHEKIHPCNTAKDRKTDNEIPSSVTTKYKNSYTMKKVNFSYLCQFISFLEASRLELFQFLIFWETEHAALT